MTPGVSEPTKFMAEGRYEVLSRLGAGGMGVVYRAFDYRAQSEVALKTLKHAEVDSLYFLKQEFRSLSDIVHRNLVNLYELEVNQEESFFTMELVEGHSLDRYLKIGPRLSSSWRGTPGATRSVAQTAKPEPLAVTEPSFGISDASGADDPSSAPEHFKELEEGRFRELLIQTAEGLSALHQAGKLHRDIKPSNVMFTPEDRAVILDFGLVLNLDARTTGRSATSMVGTPGYMSPEQVSGKMVSTASDWYSFGVLLYEAITGRLPHEGTAFEIILAKTMTRPIHPLHLFTDIPKDLCDLSMRLLEVEPEARPSADEVLEALHSVGPAATMLLAPRQTRMPGHFVGRKEELEALERGLRSSLQGCTRAVHIYGSSGYGKTALVRHFLKDVALGDKLTIIESRCYERESVPYKSIDGLVDQISDYWCALPQTMAQALVPEDIELLLEIFPVLGRVPVLEQVESSQETLLDAPTRRRRAFTALRSLLYNLADQRPLVLFLDDLQWGDFDSAVFWELLCEPQTEHPLLILVAYRSEDVNNSALIGRLAPGDHVERVEIKPLSAHVSSELAERLLGDATREGLAQQIAQEAFGSPWLIQEMAFSVADEGAPEDLQLKGVVSRRLSGLGDEAKRLIEIIAVASRPIPEVVAFEAATLNSGQLEMVKRLKNHHLLAVRARAEPLLESFHDRIRESVLQGLQPEQLRARHLALGEAWERQKADPLTLLEHFRAAEDAPRTRRYARRAAERAAEALAFEQAALLYREAMELESDPEQKLSLGEQQALALVNAGKSAEGARVFERIASLVPHAQEERVLRFQQRAAEQYLRSGLLDEGAKLLKRVARAVGITVPESPGQVLMRVLLNGLKQQLRGLSSSPEAPEALSAQTKLELDVCFGAYAGLSLVDPLLASYFQGRYLTLALEKGDPSRVARALAAEAVRHVSVGGAQGRLRFAKTIELAEEVAEQTDDPYTQGNVIFQKGSGAYLSGRWSEALKLYDEALEILRARCTGVTWELASGEMLRGSSLVKLGRFEAYRDQQSEVLLAMDQLGDRYVSTILRVGNATLLHLLQGEPELALEEVRSAMDAWPSERFLIQHFNALHSTVHIAIYQGRGEEALSQVEEAWPSINRALLLRLQELRIELRFLKAKAALAAGNARSLKLAKREAKALLKEDLALGPALGAAVMGAALIQAGQRDKAQDSLQKAQAGFQALGMEPMVAAVERIRGQVTGDDSLIQSATGRLQLVSADAVEPFFRVLLPAQG